MSSSPHELIVVVGLAVVLAAGPSAALGSGPAGMDTATPEAMNTAAREAVNTAAREAVYPPRHPQRLALIVVQVVDGKGEALAGAEVSLVRCLGVRRFTSVPSFTPANPTGVPLEPDRDGCDVVSELTDVKGVATFRNVRVGTTRIEVGRGSTVTYLLRAEKEGHTTVRRMVTPHVARNDLALVMHRTVGERMFELIDEARAAADEGNLVNAEAAMIQAVAMLSADVAVRGGGPSDALIEAMRYLAYVQLNDGNEIAALDTLNELLHMAPDDSYALRVSGVIAVRDRDWELAEAHFGSYVLFHPDSGDAHLMMGNLYLETGRLEKSIDHLEQAIEIEPENVFAYRSLGTAYEQSGRVSEAVESFQKYLLLAENPTDALQVRNTIAMLRR